MSITYWSFDDGKRSAGSSFKIFLNNATTVLSLFAKIVEFFRLCRAVKVLESTNFAFCLDNEVQL